MEDGSSGSPTTAVEENEAMNNRRSFKNLFTLMSEFLMDKKL
jgi:hypothetical protein